MVKVVALIRKPEGMATEMFLRHWQEDHPTHVWALPRLRRYVQNPARHDIRDWPYDGLAELWFDSVRDVAAAFSAPEAEPMRRHEERFIGELSWFLVEETDVPAPTA